jgi:hypothetical protein
MGRVRRSVAGSINRAGEHGRSVWGNRMACAGFGIGRSWRGLFFSPDGAKLIETLIVDVWLMWDWVAYAGLLTV